MTLPKDTVKPKTNFTHPSERPYWDESTGTLAAGGFGGGAVKKREDYTEQEMREMLDREPAKFKQIFSK